MQQFDDQLGFCEMLGREEEGKTLVYAYPKTVQGFLSNETICRHGSPHAESRGFKANIRKEI